MLFLTWMWTFFSTVVGGGVRGKGAGIARRTMIQVGATIKELHLFMGMCPRVGGMITGNIVGKGMNGTTKEYPTKKCKKTGKAGKKTDIGSGKIIGVSKA